VTSRNDHHDDDSAINIDIIIISNSSINFNEFFYCTVSPVHLIHLLI